MRALFLQAILLTSLGIVGAFSFTHWLAGALLAFAIGAVLLVVMPRLLMLHAAFAPEIGPTRG